MTEQDDPTQLTPQELFAKRWTGAQPMDAKRLQFFEEKPGPPFDPPITFRLMKSGL